MRISPPTHFLLELRAENQADFSNKLAIVTDYGRDVRRNIDVGVQPHAPLQKARKKPLLHLTFQFSYFLANSNINNSLL